MTKATKYNLFIIIVLAAIIAASVLFAKIHHAPAKHNTPAVVVTLGTATYTTLPNAVSAIGNLSAIQSTHVSSKAAGYIKALYYTEGEHVQKNQLLIQLDNEKEQAAVDSAKAQAAMSQLKYSQLQKMYRRRLVSYDDYYTAKVNDKKDKAALETAKTALIEKSIRAPFSGVIGAKTISIGDYVAPGTALATLTNITKLRALYAVPATYLSKIKRNQIVVITPNSQLNQHYKGTVSYISPSIDTQSQTIAVHADVSNPRDALKPGLFVTIRQQLGKPINVLVVPADSIFASLKGNYVMAVKDNKAYKLPVTIGQKLANSIVIQHGLLAGQSFIVQGQSKVQAGSTVTILRNTS
ncbi:MAG: hypothetical protein COB66_04135 [Coxiella sp. (in: Bacteria)]|nr:MAG: hypothetical protein COB66_04135 [Coxiella sp. (in: g-proteobacteria)]